MKGMKKLLSLLLCMMMVIGMLPTAAFATETAGTEALDLTSEFKKVQAFVDYLMGINDPSEVCSTWESEFTWDTEKRETAYATDKGKDRLYDWSYYNGVVFEGLWYLYEVTGKKEYLDYVVEYMSTLIDENGQWTVNDSSPTRTNSGYYANHGGDTIKTASLLMDLYNATKDERYKTMAGTIYADVDAAAASYSLENGGNNLRHTWESNPVYDLWLDGLYMVLPFYAEYAEETGDTDELDLIVDRLEWVSENMYDEDTQWFYHAAVKDEDTTTVSNSGTFWLRSMGWYAAAIVDVMDFYSVDSENFKSLQAQLVKLIDGLYATDSADNGYMWLNKMDGTYDATYNPYETSGSSLIYYAVMKAVNNGWLADSYADQAVASFRYMVANKLNDDSTVLTNICQKGAPTTANSYFADNEGKGVGPFIMLYAEVLEYTEELVAITVTPPTKLNYTVGETLDTTGMAVTGIRRNGKTTDLTSLISVEAVQLTEAGTFDISVSYGNLVTFFTVTVEEAPVIAEDVTVEIEGSSATATAVVVAAEKVAEKVASVLNTANLVAFDITVEGHETGTPAQVTIPMPAGVDASKFMVWYLGDDGSLEPMNGHPNADGTYTFTTTHFSTYVGGVLNDDAEVDEDNSKSTSATVRQGMTNYTYVFSASPAEFELGAGETQDITYTVTRNDSSYDFDADDIDWSTNNSSVATVDNGVVTGVSAGTATITASISVGSSYNSRTLTLTLNVTVAEKAIKSAEISPKLVKVRCGEEPDYSSVYLLITYEDGSTVTIPYTDLTFDKVDTSMPGYKRVTVTYGTQTFVIGLECVISFDGLEDATVYPEYPETGAVRINKTATEIDIDSTGLTEVELSVAGISVPQAIDVVLTVDVSNSMAWGTGTTNKEYVADNKLVEVMESIKDFAAIFLADNDDGTPTNNTITIVTFAGFDSENTPSDYQNDYIDSVRTLVTATSNINVVNSIADQTLFTGADMLKVAYIPANLDQNVVSNITTEEGSNRGDTNYDYAFWQTEQAIKDGNLGAGTRDIHVLFMTDGCASNYNNTYYRSSNVGYYYQPGTTDTYKYVTSSTGEGWAEYIRDTLIPANHGNIYANRVNAIVDGIHAVGFDMAHGSFGGLETWPSATESETLFNEIVSKSVTDTSDKGLVPVTNAASTEELNEFYTSLAHELRYSGTSGVVADTISSDFTLQLDSVTGALEEDGSGIICNLADRGITPHVSVKLYDLYPAGTTDENGNDLTGKRTGTSSVVETVVFSEDGTKAYSTAMDTDGDGVKDAILNTDNTYTVDEDTNIMTIADGVTTIHGKYFTYTKTAAGVETFDWVIGNITDKEIALSFLVYLKGSLEGDSPDGLYYTNEEATLDYINYENKHAHQVFPIPAVSWGTASTAYEFYLVNSDGQPVNRQGVVVPFANRITVGGPTYVELNLNESEKTFSLDVSSEVVLPDGYVLYDDTASYTVKTSSTTDDNGEGSLTISEPADGKVQTTVVVSYTPITYIQSHVAFGVTHYPTTVDYELVPDAVVIDYGKSIEIDVLTNNTEETGRTSKLYGFVAYRDGIDLKTFATSSSAGTELDGAYGTFSVGANNKVVYTPTSFVDAPEKVFAVIELTDKENTEDIIYMANPVTVIPATSVYYETDFADGVFDYTTTGTAWSEKTDGTEADGPQNDGTIGVDQTYGYDSTYDNDAYLSNGESQFVIGQGVKLNDKTAKYTYVDFSFTGTGFDLISRTGEQQGAIRVNIYTDAAMTSLEKSVTVLNKSESGLELYQIPVVSVNDLSTTPQTYYVRVHVNAAYTNTNYPALNRGGEFYFDAIRVYGPTNDPEAVAAYEADGESNMQLTEVRAELIAKGYDVTGGTANGVTFVDNMNSPEELDKVVDGVAGSVDVTKYENIGPNNEVYLATGQAIVVKLTTGANPTSIDVGAKSIEGDTAEFNAYISTSTSTEGLTAITKSVASSTAQNIELVNAENAATFAAGTAYVFIQNTGAGVLSITDLKVGYGAAATAEGINLASDPDTLAFAVACMSLNSTDDEEEVLPEEPEYIPNYDVISAEFSVTKTKIMRNTTLTVVTTQDVASLKIANKYGIGTQTVTSGYTDNADGTRTWTVSVRPIMIGTQKYTVTGAGADGTTGASATATLKVTLF